MNSQNDWINWKKAQQGATQVGTIKYLIRLLRLEAGNHCDLTAQSIGNKEKGFIMLKSEHFRMT
jgi:hypothetical protein